MVNIFFIKYNFNFYKLMISKVFMQEEKFDGWNCIFLIINNMKNIKCVIFNYSLKSLTFIMQTTLVFTKKIEIVLWNDWHLICCECFWCATIWNYFCGHNQTVMNKDKYVFAQLVESLDCFKFRRIVAKYQGDKYIKFFSCWNQLLVMMFGQHA